MFEKKPAAITSPDLAKMQEVVIDEKTRIYISIDADPGEAKKRYLSKRAEKKI